MKKISLYILMVIGLISTTSCEKFLDVNDDQDRPFTSTPDSLLPAVIGNLAVSHYDHGETTAYFTQQVATFSGWSKYKDRWDYVDANRIAQWRRHYHDIGINAMHVIESSEELGNADNYIAVAKICYASSTLMTSDLFGDIAYDEAFKGKPYAKYDDNAYVYGKVMEGLDKAISMIDGISSTQLEMTYKQDNVFGGDLAMWKAYALALKARLSLHLTPNVNSDYSTVISYAEAALNAGFENTAYDYSKGDPSELYQVNQWGSSIARPSWDFQANVLNKSAVTDFFLIKGLKFDIDANVSIDPRAEMLIDGLLTKSYKYVISGEGKPAGVEDSEYPNLYGNYITRDDAKLNLFSKEELYFILSEAYFYSDITKAFDNFKLGIWEHMTHVGVVDQSTIHAFMASSYIPQNSSELKLSDIMMQKYVALYLHHENWVDMRRHGYDENIYRGLKRPRNLVWYFSEEADNVWIERLPYDTQTEEIFNKPQLVEMGAYQNPDWLKKKLFWAKSN
ncbi:MAG: SusD/RagB family nutrient-binding outer membrane lipoprotein, partial [Flavobacteriales bacterium]|nr:SusD/RagB family nutrient-binding outer membrane lipoprotein [Flavobacteriales bacterium]